MYMLSYIYMHVSVSTVVIWYVVGRRGGSLVNYIYVFTASMNA